MNNEEIHRELKAQMALQGITQADIARILTKELQRPFSRATINHVLKGRIKAPAIRSAICQILGIGLPGSWTQ
jgi:hypothetical protein